MTTSCASCMDGVAGAVQPLLEDWATPPVKDPGVFGRRSTLVKALQSGDTKLLRGRWLHERLCQQGDDWLRLLFQGQVGVSLLPRHQDLPDKAFWTPEELVPRLGQPNRAVQCVAVSYHWQSDKHPDPDAQQLKTLAAVLQHWLYFYGGMYSWDLAIFLDFCSLPQAPRTQDEEETYKRARADTAIWYAHQDVDVWLLPRPSMHTGESGDTVPCARAWPLFEQMLARLAPRSGRTVLDLSKMNQQCNNWEATDMHCAMTETTPPLPPVAFAAAVDKAPCRVEADRELLKDLYTSAFDASMSVVQEMFLEGLGWGDEQAAQLAEVLVAKCHNVRAIFLAHNAIGDRGAQALAEAFSNCPWLSVVMLDFNNIGPVGAQKLASTVPKCRRLVELGLCGNPVTDDGAAALAKALPHCPRLGSLFLDRTGMGDQGAAALAEGIVQCKSLERLVLSNNSIGDEGATVLSESLPLCRKFSHLDINRNQIGDDGAASLAKSLPRSRHFRSLNLARNTLGQKFAAALLEAIPKCGDLSKLGLEGTLKNKDDADRVEVAWTEAGKKKSDLRLGQFRDNTLEDAFERSLRNRIDLSTPIISSPGSMMTSPPRSPDLIRRSAGEVYEHNAVEVVVLSQDADRVWIILAEALLEEGIKHFHPLLLEHFYVHDSLGRLVEPSEVIRMPLIDERFPLTIGYSPPWARPKVTTCASFVDDEGVTLEDSMLDHFSACTTPTPRKMITTPIPSSLPLGTQRLQKTRQTSFQVRAAKEERDNGCSVQ
eukprot:TRINITY_DN124095_c0_g1_i1.p1 TRINITY_DN124095_c0_g1~~TRINITY_DN124095_c0_g1_i1.p1  ORF type:complete len:768 (-),score=178.53 TRINITY_DN124095_c0_g1_i1:249-2552(-)